MSSLLHKIVMRIHIKLDFLKTSSQEDKVGSVEGWGSEVYLLRFSMNRCMQDFSQTIETLQGSTQFDGLLEFSDYVFQENIHYKHVNFSQISNIHVKLDFKVIEYFL